MFGNFLGALTSDHIFLIIVLFLLLFCLFFFDEEETIFIPRHPHGSFSFNFSSYKSIFLKTTLDHISYKHFFFSFFVSLS